MKLRIAAAAMAIGLAAYAKAPAIGYMLDISRDKVPTMETLFRIVDTLSKLGYNQFQLYTDHTFAYKAHKTVWANASPMTAEEIRTLDAYCRDRGIELVPNQNSFGHLEKWFKHPEYRPMAEAPYGGVKTPWKTPMVIPRALCPTDPKSIEFVASLYDELLPNFSSKLFNVGCDEVWELESEGQGRSWSEVQRISRQRVWIDFFKKVAAEAEKRGRTPMFWDDMIVRRHPELIPELPKNAIALEWGYDIKKGFDAGAYERDCANLSKNGYRFYVCPGSSSWNAITGRHFNMKTNVNEAVSAGLKYGAEGFLMCDWGNGGSCQPWITTLPALFYMRAKIDGKTLTDDEIAAKIDGFVGAKCGRALIRYQNLYLLSGNPDIINCNSLHTLLSRGMEFKPRGLTDETIAAVAAEHKAAKGDLDLAGAPDWVKDGFATMDHVLEATYLRWKGEHDRIARDFPQRFRELWLKYNRPGGLDDSINKNFRPERQCEVLVVFSTEDYTCPQTADGIADLTRICLEEGIVPQHQVVGELARKLVEWKRNDVIDVMRKCVIGTQSRYHSLHPDLLELSDGMDYAAAYRRVREQEEASVNILRDVFGIKRIWASSPPGNSESYVANRVYADLGVKFDIGASFCAAKGGDVWFAGQRRIAYGFNLERLLQSQPDASSRCDWKKDGKRLLDEWASQDRFCLNCRPNMVYAAEPWDSLNYSRKNVAKWGQWIQPKMRDPEEVRKYLDDVRSVLRAIREDPRFVFKTLPEIAVSEKPREPIKLSDIRSIRWRWQKKGFGPIRNPSWCIADVFCAAARLLAGDSEYMPRNAFGFLEMPYSTPAQIDVTRDEIVAAAKAMDVSGYLPASIQIGGGRRIGPRQFLFAAIEFLSTEKDVVTVVPGDQLGSFEPLNGLEFSSRRNTWHHCPPPEFEDAYASDRLRWQIWTLRYE